MKKYLTFIITIMFGAIVIMGMTGCGARGNQFSGFSQPPKNEGILYVYRPSAVGSGGVKYTVYDVTNEKVIGTLRNGGYIRYKTKPGKIVISMLHDSHTAVAGANLAITLINSPLINSPNYISPYYMNRIKTDIPENIYSVNIRKNDISCIRWNASGDKKVPNGSVDKSTCRKEIAKTKLSPK